MQNLPEWILFTEDSSPSHGEYMVLLKQGDERFPYIAVAEYSYGTGSGGFWFTRNKLRGIIYLTKQVHAWQEPRVRHCSMLDGDSE